ncbi:MULTISPECIES: NAD-dependent epimerase/dehydratase family protein [Bradyrhizobium]|uniref:NAD-dependent epimerase/dehydratase family protein n=1 Tax=Bradyrhizobium pachyrhizi TaxID=280333 RepID=UPI002AA50E9D
MKVAVIGATGLLGSAIVADLSSQGHSIVSMSRAPESGVRARSRSISTRQRRPLTGCPSRRRRSRSELRRGAPR